MLKSSMRFSGGAMERHSDREVGLPRNYWYLYPPEWTLYPHGLSDEDIYDVSDYLINYDPGREKPAGQQVDEANPTP